MLLSVSNVKKAFGPDQILLGVTLRLERKERVALVGRNGAGKSTLLKILTGQYPPDSGSVQFAQGAKVGYLKQEQPVTFGRTVLEEAQAATEEKLRLQVRLRELEDLLADNNTDPDILEEYTLVHEHFLDSEGYSVETDVRTVLLKMGFEESEFSKITDSLSGGEKTRLAIARLLLEEPDLLILDEPTNHLDLQATEWLENWIRGYHGAILLVSHDRTFLENTAQRVIHMADGTVKSYPGTFEKYRQLRAEEEARLVEVAKRQDQEIARMDEYVRRFMNSQRTAQARGRLKMKDKLIQSKVNAPKSDRQMAGGFGASSRSGDIVIQTKKLDVGFDDGTLIHGLDWTVQMGERWGIVGENGAGKSTLVKTCMGEHPILSGEAKLGSGVVAGYFTQDASDLDPELSSLDTLCMVDGMTPPDARNLLGRFLISGEDVYRPIRTLSGGEKNKLSLARLTHVRPNLLVLDEPTNHLDMASRDALVEVLRDFKGTLIVVSHDRWLLSQVTDRTLDVRKDQVIQYTGNFIEYRARQMKGGSTTKAAAATPSIAQGLTPREVSKLIQQLTKEVASIEDQISAKEGEIKERENKLATVTPQDDIHALSKGYQEMQTTLATLLATWETKSEELAALEASRN